MTCIFHDVEQNTDEWMEMRIGIVTASNYATFMANDGKDFGDPAKRYALQIALERITGRKSGASYTNEHMQRGHEQEPIARMLYEHENFVDVINGGFFTNGQWGDSPDGLIGDDGVIEIKSVIASTHYETLKRKSFDPAYRWQLAGHLDATGRDWVDFVSYCDDFPARSQLIIYRSTRDDMKIEIEKLAARREKFLELIATTLESLK